jgi:predicted HTH transcriptional regulator
MAAMAKIEINDLVKYPNEERYLEFKGPIHWAGVIQVKITKSVMAMANLRDGGWIIIGKEEQPDRTFKAVGLSQEESDSFDPDDIKAFVYAHVEPPVTFEVIKKEVDSKKFVILKIDGFSEIPIICKKGCGDLKAQGDVIHAGKVYVRSKGKPESIPVPSDAEMREIIEIAVDRGVSSFVERLQRTGIWAPKLQKESFNDEEKFNKQIEALR